MRWLNVDDAGLMLAVWNDPAFMRFVGDRGIRSIEAACDELAGGPLLLYEQFGYGPYRLALKPSGTPIGICGLFRHRGLEEADIGYAVLPQFCGNGYAHEAARAVIEHARSRLGMRRIIAIVAPENAASIGLLEKLGLRFERMHRMREDENEVCIYGIQLDE